MMKYKLLLTLLMSIVFMALSSCKEENKKINDPKTEKLGTDSELSQVKTKKKTTSSFKYVEHNPTTDLAYQEYLATLSSEDLKLAQEYAEEDYYLYRVGETDQLKRILQAIENSDEQYCFNQWFSSSPYIKFQLLKELKPEITVFGSPRFNQFRKGMFAPYSFYGAGMLAPKLNAAEGLILSLPDDALPKIMFVLVDPYMFRDKPNNKPVDYNIMPPPLKRPKHYEALRKFWEKEPASKAWAKDKDSGTKFLGIRAIRSQRGVRSIDGSVSYGDLHNRTLETQKRDEINRRKTAAAVIKKKGILKGYESHMLESAFNDWKKVILAGQNRGVTVIGLSLIHISEPTRPY